MVQEFTGSNLPGVNLVWAAVLIGIAVIILVAQQITHRLALRREADARGDLSRRLIEARERLATGPFALIEWSGAAGAIELEPRAAELLSLNRPQTTLEEVRGLLQTEGPNAEETWAALLAGKGAAQAVMRHVHTGRRLRLQRPEQGGARRLWLDDVGETMALVDESRAAVRGFMELLDRLPMPIWCRDENLAITYGNQAFHRLLDLPPGEAPRSGRDINSAARALAARAQKLGMVQSESQQQVVGGKRRLFDFNEAPLPTGALIGFALDQTALEDTHSELARHIAAHDDVLQSLGTAIVIFGPDKRVKFFNAAYRDLFEMDPQFLQSEPTIDEVLDSLRERRQITEQADFRNYKQEFARHIMSIIAPFEELMHTPKGRTFRMVATPHPMGGVILTYEDVTDKLALEASYNTLIEVQRETIDHLYEGIAVYGSDGRLKLHNSAFTRMWSLTEEEIANQPHVSKVVDLVAKFFSGRKDWPSVRERIVSEVAERELRNLRIERSDRKVIDVAAIPLPDGGRLYKYTDVTDSINMERALRERNEALMAADRLKSEFIANVSYEFRTPLERHHRLCRAAVAAVFRHAEREAAGIQPRHPGCRAGAAAADLRRDRRGGDRSRLYQARPQADRREGHAGGERAPVPAARPHALGRAQPRHGQRAGRDRGRPAAPEAGACPTCCPTRLSAAPYGGTVTLRAKRQPLQLALAVEVSSGPSGEGSAIESSSIPAEIGGSAGSGRDVTSGLGIALVRTLVELHGGRVETEIGLGYRRVVCTLPLDPTSHAAAAS